MPIAQFVTRSLLEEDEEEGRALAWKWAIREFEVVEGVFHIQSMASLMAGAALGKGQFACCELNFVVGGRGCAALVPMRSPGRRVGAGRNAGGAVRASSSGTADENMIPDSSGSYTSRVDESMMVLRRRIEGLRMKDTFIQTPEEWMDWEKSCYSTYRADVNILLASLQSMLLGMRPGVVLFIISFLLAAAPVAFFLFLSALGSQLYTLNNSVLDFIAPCSTALPPPM